MRRMLRVLPILLVVFVVSCVRADVGGPSATAVLWSTPVSEGRGLTCSALVPRVMGMTSAMLFHLIEPRPGDLGSYEERLLDVWNVEEMDRFDGELVCRGEAVLLRESKFLGQDAVFEEQEGPVVFRYRWEDGMVSSVHFERLFDEYEAPWRASLFETPTPIPRSCFNCLEQGGATTAVASPMSIVAGSDVTCDRLLHRVLNVRGGDRDGYVVVRNIEELDRSYTEVVCRGEIEGEEDPVMFRFDWERADDGSVSSLGFERLFDGPGPSGP